MGIYAHLKAMVDEYRYAGVPAQIQTAWGERSPTQVGELGPRQLSWLNLNIRNFQKYREQAEASRRG